jgi:hypothetical protein
MKEYFGVGEKNRDHCKQGGQWPLGQSIQQGLSFYRKKSVSYKTVTSLFNMEFK